jgi:hypothetical protein
MIYIEFISKYCFYLLFYNKKKTLF